jgi:hypothetical protein
MKRWRVFLLAVFCLLPVCSTFAQTSTPTTSALPRLVRFSGTVPDLNRNPPTGLASITFALYAEQTGGAPLWMETQNVTADSSGHYTALLGATQSAGLPAELFASEQAHWVGVQIQGQPEQPRVLLVSAPYALKAGDAETIGGLPPSAFMLAAPSASAPAAGTVVTNATPDAATDVTTTGGTANYLPLFNGASTIVDSVVYQTAAGKIGINTATPSATLDVKGGALVAGTLTLPESGVATASTGFNSQPLNLTASAFNSGTSTAVPQTFQLKAEPSGNDTASAGGVLSLLYGSGASAPAATGLQIASDGVINFAAGQTFPGTGTITGVTAGTGLSGGGSSGAVTLNNTGLLGLVAGTGISIGSGQAPTVSVSSAVPLLASANTFTANQTVNGSLSASNYLIGGQLFDSGSYSALNAFLGFAGNTTMTGTANTASGYQALFSNTTGAYNTASGNAALFNNSTGTDNTAVGSVALNQNSTGGYNTASGVGALYHNTTGTANTASGYEALFSSDAGNFNTGVGSYAGQAVDGAILGNSNTFLGANSTASGGTLSNATAIGANAEVAESNAMVLGAITGVNSGTSVNVGIGTTTPAYTLDVHGTGNFTGAVTFASGQKFPGTGTVTSVGAGTGLTGGPITGRGTLSIAPNTCVAGSALSALPFTCSPFATLGYNTFTASQTVEGSVTASGTVTAGTVMAGTVSATGSVSAPSVSASTSVVGASAVSGSNSAISGTSNGGYFSTASSAGTAVVGVNSAGGYAGYFQGNAIVTGEHSTGTLSIGGDAPMSHNPHMVFSGFLAGNLGSAPTGGLFIPDDAIIITRVDVSASSSGSGCSTAAQVTVENYYAGQTTIASVALPNNAPFGTSGAISVSVAAGTSLLIGALPASGCSITGGSPSNVFVNVQYVMQ